MTDIIMIVIIAAILLVASRGAVKHLKGEGGCCGGGSSVKAKKKKLDGKIAAEKIISIDGMHCDHCKNSVERALNALDGVASKVNLNKKQAVVTMTRLATDEELRAAVEHAGFTVTGIADKEV